MSTEISQALPSKEALVRTSRVALAQGATVALQSIMAGVITANPVLSIVVGPLINGVWKAVRTAQEKKHGEGNANWFWKIF